MTLSKSFTAISDLLATGTKIESEGYAVSVAKEARMTLDKCLVAGSLHDYFDASNLDTSDYNSGKRLQKPWVSTIAIEVAELNDCALSISGGKRSNLRYEFKGFKVDGDLSVAMLTYLVDACDSIYDNCKGTLGLSGLADKNDFYRVMGVAIKNGLKQAQEERAEFMCLDDERGNNHNQRARMVRLAWGTTSYQPIKSKRRNKIKATKGGSYAAASV